MARKNRNAQKDGRSRKYAVARNTHFLYSTDEFGEDATVVRYMGEQQGDLLLCHHPEGMVLWCHVSHLSRSISRAA